jgi:hypothetical protein
VLVFTASVQATPPSTPITIDLSLSHAPGLNESATVTITVTSIVDAPGTVVELVLPPDVVSTTPSWTVDLLANTPVTLSSSVFVQATGNVTISARAFKAVGAQAAWGDMKSVPVTVGSPVSGPSERQWTVAHVPVATLAQPGTTAPLSSDATPFSFPSPARNAPGLAPDAPPSTIPQQDGGVAVGAPSAPGNVTLTGRWQYPDRSGVTRDADQQLLEIRQGNGNALATPVFCYTAVDGTFSCTFPHPGTTMRVWIRSWTSFNRPGGSDRLGVFSGPEVTGGCGSDSYTCSYPVQTGEITCADGATCAIGTWIVNSVEPWIGAHWMTQDLIRSWKRLFFDPRHGTGITSGPGRITYPVPAGHGTHAHVPPGDGWISMEPPNQQSADIVLHEYGHVVMANIWTGFSPTWPTSDCPSPHFIGSVSGPGCALSEGFANFWAWYGNEFYDGDNVTGNDGPVFNWPSGASTNLETRDGGTYDAGDRVEGNIAAVLGDVFDAANEGPAIGPSDRLTGGIEHIWHTLSSQSDFNFSQWFTAYWSTHGHDPCPVLSIINFNSIPYSLSQCAQTITVGSPNGGEVWPIGSTRAITWNSSGLTGSVKIEVSRNGGSSWTTIIANTLNDGTHSWIVTGPATTQARIRVTSLTSPAVSDTSNANFTIGGGFILVGVPNGGEVWPIGSTRAVTWFSSGLTGNVKIEVSRNGGSTWTSVIANTLNDGTHNWIVTGPATTQGRIRVTSLTDPTVSDTSNANFTIGGGSITVTSPNSGQVWPIGSSNAITWNSSGLTGNVRIEVSRNGGATWTTIISSTPNDGTHTWLVTGPATTQGRIRVKSVTDPTVSDMSDANVTFGGGGITVVSPNGGEVWAIGSSHHITWGFFGLAGNVKIELSRNGGVTWVTLVASTPNDLVHTWVVTGPATALARIRVTSVTNPLVSDTSNANFTIQ